MSDSISFFDSQPLITTARLRLRALRSADAAAIFAYASKPAVTKYTLFHMHESITDSEDFIATVELQSGPSFGLVWAIEPTERESLIGTIGIHNVNLDVGSVEVGYAFNDTEWGNGYASEALAGVIACVFAQTEISRIEAHCVAEHIASTRVMEKAGMQYEGTLRASRLLQGNTCDMKVYSILRNEFETRHH